MAAGDATAPPKMRGHRDAMRAAVRPRYGLHRYGSAPVAFSKDTRNYAVLLFTAFAVNMLSAG